MNGVETKSGPSKARRRIATTLGLLAALAVSVVLAVRVFGETEVYKIAIARMEYPLIDGHDYFFNRMTGETNAPVGYKPTEVGETGRIRGWPLSHGYRTEVTTDAYYPSRSTTTSRSQEVDYLQLAMNVAICAVLVLGTGLGLADLALRACWPPRFTLMTIFGVTLVSALALSLCLEYAKAANLIFQRDSGSFRALMIIALLLTLNAILVVARFVGRRLQRRAAC
jgi:hypothetical protein